MLSPSERKKQLRRMTTADLFIFVTAPPPKGKPELWEIYELLCDRRLRLEVEEELDGLPDDLGFDPNDNLAHVDELCTKVRSKLVGVIDWI